jgi:UDP-glucuronate 4-epimerase
VTGAAGFIGFHVAQHLKKAGHAVVGLDNFCSYYSPQLKRDRALQLLRNGVRVIEQSVEETEKLRALVEREGVSHIVHLAAQAGVRYSLDAPKEYLRSNIDGFLSVLEVVRAHPSIVTVWASSSSVYGANAKLPFSEEDKADSPTNLYGATKKANEAMAFSYHHLFGMTLIGLRFFTVYGPWGRPDMAYFLFANKMAKGEPIDLYGGGTLQRDFTYVDDIVNGVEAALFRAQGCTIFNLGNCHTESVEYLVSCLERSLGYKANVRRVERPSGDMVATWADIHKAERELGFSPKVSLAEGIDRFAQWYRSYYHGN